MAEQANLMSDTERHWILTESEYADFIAAKRSQERTMAMIRRVFVDDTDGFDRVLRVLKGAKADTGESVDLLVAMEQVLDERDRARVAADRLRRLSGDNSYTLALLEGTAG